MSITDIVLVVLLNAGFVLLILTEGVNDVVVTKQCSQDVVGIVYKVKPLFFKINRC